MRMGYWHRGDVVRKSHLLTPAETPICGVPVYPNTELTRFHGDLAHLDCMRCMATYRVKLRRDILSIGRRLRGLDGWQGALL